MTDRQKDNVIDLMLENLADDILQDIFAEMKEQSLDMMESKVKAYVKNPETLPHFPDYLVGAMGLLIHLEIIPMNNEKSLNEFTRSMYRNVSHMRVYAVNNEPNTAFRHWEIIRQLIEVWEG